MGTAPDLYHCCANDLDLNTYIQEYLQPNEVFRRQVNTAVDTICAFLKENCYRGHPSKIKVLKVVKGGSSAKGTALKVGSDADLVVFLDCFHSYNDQYIRRKEIIEEISKKLEECKRKNTFEVQIEKTKWNNPRVLSFCMRSTKVPDFIDFDVLPAYNALGQLTSGYKPPPEVYLRLIRDASPGENFSSCFTELQREFIISRPTKVKSFIRLVKHWYKTKLHGNRNVPPKYAFELLSIYAWEKGSNGQQRFNMAQSFRNFLELICNYRELCVWWTENYNLYDNAELGEFLEEQIEKPRPVILDPADPTGNFGEGYNWELVAIEAGCCLSRMHYRTSAGLITEFRDLPPTLPNSLISRSSRYVPQLNSWSTDADNEWSPPPSTDADNEWSPPPTQQESSGTYCTIL